MNGRWIVTLALLMLVVVATGVLAVAPSAIERGAVEVRGASYVESIDMLFDARPGGELSLGTSLGSVSVRTWARDQIRLMVTKRTRASDMEAARRILEMFSVRALHGGGNLGLKGLAKTKECAAAVDVKFTIWVPASYNLDITTEAGSIDLPEVDGTLNAHTGAGKITVDCDAADVDIEVEDRTQSTDPAEPKPGDDEVDGGNGEGGSL